MILFQIIKNSSEYVHTSVFFKGKLWFKIFKINSKSGSQEPLAQLTKHEEMGKIWKAFSWVSVQISLQKSGGLQLMLLKSLHLGKLWFSKTPFSAKHFKLSTILLFSKKERGLIRCLWDFFHKCPSCYVMQSE